MARRSALFAYTTRAIAETMASTMAIMMARSLFCILVFLSLPGGIERPAPSWPSAGPHWPGIGLLGKLLHAHRGGRPARLPAGRGGQERDGQIDRVVEGDRDGLADRRGHLQVAVGDRADARAFLHDLPVGLAAAADVVPAVNADHGHAGTLTCAVGGLDLGVEGDPELDQAEQHDHQDAQEDGALHGGHPALSMGGDAAPPLPHAFCSPLAGLAAGENRAPARRLESFDALM